MRGTVAFVLLATGGPVAHADVVWAVRPEPGLACLVTSSPLPPIFDAPRGTATMVAIAGPMVFAIQPQRVENGYVEVERPNRQIGWIEQKTLSPPPTTCTPTLMSNGLILTGGTR